MSILMKGDEFSDRIINQSGISSYLYGVLSIAFLLSALQGADMSVCCWWFIELNSKKQQNIY